MIITTKYNNKVKWKRARCEICHRLRWVCQHHVDGRRNTDEIIHVCSNGNPGGVVYPDACHSKIHNPTAFGLDPSWAYDNGYLRRLDGEYRPKKKPASKWKLKKKIGF